MKIRELPMAGKNLPYVPPSDEEMHGVGGLVYVVQQQHLRHSCETQVGYSSVEISNTGKCLNDSSRAYTLKLGVASSLASALERSSASAVKCSVFPAWPPGVYEL